MISESRICFEENVDKAKKDILKMSEEMTRKKCHEFSNGNSYKKRKEFFHDISIIANNEGSEVQKSEQNHFQELSMDEDVTRTGKCTDDLDESDARAIGKKSHFDYRDSYKKLLLHS